MEANSSFVERVGQWPASTKSYIEELQMEMRRVTWPSRKQVESTTVVVILTVFAFAAYFQVVDQVLASSITKLTHVFAR